MENYHLKKISTFNTVCIVASPRSGSNLLCEQLQEALSEIYINKVINLYEYLSPHQYVTENGKLIVVDPEDLIDRPNSFPIDLYRLKKLCTNTNDIKIFKILPRDITNRNYHLLNQIIFDNPKTYTICLNRFDVSNQILSYFIGKATGIWHSNQKSDLLENKSIYVKKEEMEKLGNEIILHYLWHAENKKRCNKIVWYDQLMNTSYYDLLGHNNFMPETQTKLNTNHIDIVHKSISNSFELIDYANKIELQISEIREILR